MKVTVPLQVTLKVKNPDGYPDEFDAIEDGKPKTKRERQVLVAYARAVKAAQEQIVELIEEEGLKVKQSDGQVQVK